MGQLLQSFLHKESNLSVRKIIIRVIGEIDAFKCKAYLKIELKCWHVCILRLTH
jgi:hypothetical protein